MSIDPPEDLENDIQEIANRISHDERRPVSDQEVIAKSISFLLSEYLGIDRYIDKDQVEIELAEDKPEDEESS